MKKAQIEKEIQELMARVAAPNRLYKYDLDGVILFSPQRLPQGFRPPTGRAKFTKEYYNVSGQLAKELKEEQSEGYDASHGDPDYAARHDFAQKHH